MSGSPHSADERMAWKKAIASGLRPGTRKFNDFMAAEMANGKASRAREREGHNRAGHTAYSLRDKAKQGGKTARKPSA